MAPRKHRQRLRFLAPALATWLCAAGATSARAAERAPGSHKGELVAYGQTGPVIRRAISIGLAPAKPALKALTFRAEWLIPDHIWLRGQWLALDPSSGTDSSKLDLKAGQVLG